MSENITGKCHHCDSEGALYAVAVSMGSILDLCLSCAENKAEEYCGGEEAEILTMDEAEWFSTWDEIYDIPI